MLLIIQKFLLTLLVEFAGVGCTLAVMYVYWRCLAEKSDKTQKEITREFRMESQVQN